MTSRRSALLAALAAVPAYLFPRWAASAPARSSFREGCVRLPDGRRLGYSECGDPSGPLVVYFHGTPGSRLETRMIAGEAAAAGVRLVAVERPGIGLSDFQPGRTILDWPADVECLVGAIGYGTPAFGVIGLSGGAPYALACVKCIPHRLTHVAIVSGHAPMNAPGVEPGGADRLIVFIRRRPRISEIGIRVAIGQLRHRPDRFLRQTMRRLAASDEQLIIGSAENRDIFLLAIGQAVRSGPAGVMRDVQLLGGHWGFRLADLPPAPISIWHGGCDPIAPPSTGDYFQRQLAGSELFVDPRAGHLTMAKWHAAEIFAKFAQL